jgi:hypothetical protein
MEAINRAALKIARDVAGERALVAGTLCLPWQKHPSLGSPRSLKGRVRTGR